MQGLNRLRRESQPHCNRSGCYGLLIQYQAEECGPFTVSLVQCTHCTMKGVVYVYFPATGAEPTSILVDAATVEDENGLLVPQNFDDWFSLISVAGASFEG